jgi:hypothetical protein
MLKLTCRIVLLILFSTSPGRSENTMESIPADFDRHIANVVQNIDFSRAVILLKDQGCIVNVEVPFLLPSIALKLNGADLTVHKVLDQIKIAYGFDYKIHGSQITIYDPKLQPSDKEYPLNQRIKNFVIVEKPYNVALEELSKQCGISIVALSQTKDTRTTSVNINDSSVEEILSMIRKDISSRGWYCLINKKDNKTTVLVIF